MDTIKYVFWDSDNTLVETANHHWRKNYETLKSLGIALDEKYRARIYENNSNQNWEWLATELGLALSQEDYVSRTDRWYFEHLGDMIVRPGVEEALALFKSAGCRQAVVSNGRRRSVMAALTAKALVPHFDFILCKEDYQGRKPDPAPYLAAKTKMQQITGDLIDPQTCLVIEDDPKGVMSGRAAGMAVIDRPPGPDDAAAFLETVKTYTNSAGFVL